MPETAGWQHLLQFLLTSTEHYEEVVPFLERILPEARGVLAVESAAVVRATPPDWQVVSCSGCSPRNVPTPLAAEALDKGDFHQQGEWSVVPIADKHALLLRGEVSRDDMLRLRSAMTDAFLNVQKQQQRKRRIRRLEKILDVTHAWGQTNRMEDLLQAMAEAATELLTADRASIFLWDKANKTLVGRPALGLKDDELRIPDDTGIVGQVIQTGEPRRVDGGRDEDQIARAVDTQTGYHTKTLLCVPLRSPTGKLLGAFEVLNKRGGRFTEEDERGLLELASHAAVALESTKQLEELLTKHQQLIEAAAEGVQLIGISPAIEAVRSTIRRIADTDLAILILGENGTGKEVVARSIHYLSRRRDQPFIAVNCAALTETLLESELFGHEKGAFTDAYQTRAGKFELASGGTLFLDEIGDMSPSGQAKLLRVLEEKTVVRVGGSTPIHTEVRIVAATNQDLARMVREKKFREDLYFRLNVVSLELPPLRERGEDILQLAEFFLGGFCRNMGRRMPDFSAVARKKLLVHAWPGNIRELRNLMERLAYLSSGDRIEGEDLAFIDTGEDADNPENAGTLTEATRLFQQRHILQMIERAQGNMSLAAKRLGLHRSNLYRKMRQLEMGVSEEEEFAEE
jgi:Nif-specific regulatory protein